METGFSPIRNDWFSTQVAYEGIARVQLSSIGKYITGHANVKVSETGEVDLIMNITEGKQLEGIMYSTYGSGSLVFYGGTKVGSADRIEVQTTDGIFRISQPASCTIKRKDSSPNEWLLDTSPIWSEFEVINAPKAKYWVVALSNFLSTCVPHKLQLGDHPLRLMRFDDFINELRSEGNASAIPSDLSEMNSIISFEFNGGAGFIERLPDYEDRETDLLSWKEKRSITAVMVGEIGNNSIQFHDLDTWFPTDFLPLLELATGLEVGMSWLEFRDENGQLVRRIHSKRGSPYNYKARPARFPIVPTDQIGQLLSEFAASPNFHNRALRAAIRQLSRNGFTSRNFEETIGFLSRCLDEICEEYQLRGKILPSILTPVQQAKIDGIIDNAAKQVQQERLLTQDVHQKRTLKTIERNLKKSTQRHESFGQRLCELLRHPDFGFHDADIVDNHYSSQPRKDSRMWHEAVSYIRNVAAHDNFFDTTLPEHDTQDNLKLVRHLHDVAARIVLKMIGYTGVYYPLGTWNEELVDWVTPNIPVSELGYS